MDQFIPLLSTEVAGFNIAFLAFFACTTITLWNG